MKPIQKNELYEHVRQFLKAKGIEMQEGSYPRGIQKGCSILADAINLSQKGLSQAKEQIDKNLDRMRQVIHEKTAPKTAPQAGGGPKPEAQAPKAETPRPKAKPRAAKKKAAKR